MWRSSFRLPGRKSGVLAAPLLLVLLLAAISACTDSPLGIGEQRDVSDLQMSANVSGTSISTLVVRVSAADIATPLAFNLEVVNGTATGTLKVPAGSARLFEVKAYDTSGGITHEGSKTVNVARGSNPPLSIPLAPRPGEVPVEITMGDYSVVVNPASATLTIGSTQQLSATVTGPSVDPTQVRWATSNPSIATVSSSGLVTAIASGDVQIVATYEGVGGSSRISVGVAVGSIEISPSTAAVLVGSTQQYTAVLKDAAGNVLSDRAPTWESSNTSVATIDASGLAMVHAVGSTTITARSGTQSASASLSGEQIVSGTITAGGYHSCGLTQSGAAYCWGRNSDGALGDGTTVNRSTPTAVLGGLTFRSIRAGDFHTVAVTPSGAAYAWGYNGFGQLGDGTASNRPSPVAVLGGLTFASVDAGAYHSVALTASGAAYAWGSNSTGQLGDGTTTQRLSPVAVLGGLTFSSVDAGTGHTVALTTSGSAYGWGRNSDGQLGDGTGTDRSSPVAVLGGLTFSSISAGVSHTVAVTPSGAAYAWGHNSTGALGDGTTTNRPSPVAVQGGLTFASVDAGAYHSVALTASGAAYAWGSNGFGQLGDGTTTNRPSPVAVQGGLTFKLR